MSLYPSSNNESSTKKNNSNNGLFPARVKDICLNSDSPIFIESKGWAGLGNITFQPLYKNIDKGDSLLMAKPLYSNIKQYPLKEELVLILNSPSILLNENPNALEFYYIPIPIGLWNNINHNVMPDINKYDSNPKELNMGNTFKERDDVRSLLPEEGDVIIEGRFGNGIRFSSTTPNKKINNNSWSSEGDFGKPITIITNNYNNSEGNPWNPAQEDINTDGSSIYLTSGQEILLDFACKNLQSLNITIANSFNSVLQIPDNNLF